MVRCYLRKSLKVAKLREKSAPKHPHYSRSVVKDGKVVPVDSYDEVPSDVVQNDFVSFSTYVEAGEQVPKMGGFTSAVNHLTEQRVAEIFLEQFNQLERMKQPANPPAPASAPAPAPAPANPVVEPQK